MLISNARVVTRDDVFIGTVQIDGESIRAVSRGTTAARDADDWGGDYLLPGLVELHTDNLEKHLAPRPGVYWNVDAAFVTHDAQVAAAGITTVFDALAIGTRLNVGVRGRDVQTQCADALARFASHGLLRAEHFLHLRCEIATEDVVDVFDSLARHPRLRLASVMDHTPGQRQWKDPQQWRHYQERHRKWSDEEAATTIAELADEQQRYADAHRRAIVARCRALGVPVASHDDTVIEHVEQAAREGIALAEFPTTHAAAEAARARGIATVMGAPNLVRGGSHSGNVSALALARRGSSTSCRPTTCRRACYARRSTSCTRRTGACRARSTRCRARRRAIRGFAIAAKSRRGCVRISCVSRCTARCPCRARHMFAGAASCSASHRFARA
ncbi:amidohydrolase family protein [Burkholderia pseudomallei NCTC 13179]|nr:amidohydrolase family protein [Burkholderia pseudomallei NCTC 13179]